MCCAAFPTSGSTATWRWTRYRQIPAPDRKPRRLSTNLVRCRQSRGPGSFQFPRGSCPCIDHHLLNLWLIDLKLAVFEQDIFPLGSLTSAIICISLPHGGSTQYLLRIFIVDDFLVLLQTKSACVVRKLEAAASIFFNTFSRLADDLDSCD